MGGLAKSILHCIPAKRALSQAIAVAKRASVRELGSVKMITNPDPPDDRGLVFTGTGKEDAVMAPL
jgi:hypothetical protein